MGFPWSPSSAMPRWWLEKKIRLRCSLTYCSLFGGCRSCTWVSRVHNLNPRKQNPPQLSKKGTSLARSPPAFPHHPRASCFHARRIFQLFPQPPVRTEQPQPHRHHRNPQPVRHFLRRVLQHIAQQARLPQIRRQLFDRVGQHAGQLLAARIVPPDFPPGPGSRRPVFRRRSHAALPATISSPRAAAAAHRSTYSPQCVPAMPGNRPSCRRSRRRLRTIWRGGLPGKLLQSRPCLQQRFLAHIFRVRHISGHPPRSLVQRRHIRRNHFGKRLAVSLPRLRQQARPSPRHAVQFGEPKFRECERSRAHFAE